MNLEASSRHRRSKQREIILEELRKLVTHPRSDELYAIVRRRLPHISLGTVYRNLDRLQTDGLALEIYCGDFVRYDGDTSPHDHFMCRSCRRVWDFESARPESGPTWEQLPEQSGFHIDAHYTTFFGTCPACSRTHEDRMSSN